jgi:hypothetical protein
MLLIKVVVPLHTHPMCVSCMPDRLLQVCRLGLHAFLWVARMGKISIAVAASMSGCSCIGNRSTVMDSDCGYASAVVFSAMHTIATIVQSIMALVLCHGHNRCRCLHIVIYARYASRQARKTYGWNRDHAWLLLWSIHIQAFQMKQALPFMQQLQMHAHYKAKQKANRLDIIGG